MPEYPHDPEFPYLVLSVGGNQVGKFRSKFLAEEYRRVSKTEKMWDIVDTTPKPRIPVDAQYLAIKAGKMFAIAIRKELGWRVIGDGQPIWFPDESFAALFKDDEITVLDPRKEES